MEQTASTNCHLQVYITKGHLHYSRCQLCGTGIDTRPSNVAVAVLVYVTNKYNSIMIECILICMNFKLKE
jgi:hypothetical protein